MGDVDPKSVEMRVSGFGLVPAVYDPKTKSVTYVFTQKLLPKKTQYLVWQLFGNRLVMHRVDGPDGVFAKRS